MGIDCVEKFEEHIKDAIKELYITFPKQPITELMCCKELEGAEGTAFDDNGEELKR